MTISDLLTLLGIILAIIAFISEKNRGFVFLKFSNRSKGLLIFVFIFLHFLLSYQWFCDRFDFLSVFYVSWLPASSAWAYIIAISTLVWAVYKIFWASFPLDNRESLMKYYNNLIKRNEIMFLSELVENYHLNNITDYLKSENQVIPQNQLGFFERNTVSPAKSNSQIFGNNVFMRVILNDKFIAVTSDEYPHLFSEIIIHLNTENTKQVEFVNHFLKILTLKKNSSFFNEIRNNQNYEEFNSYRIETERPILYSLFYDINVAKLNNVWKGIGEQAIVELHNEIKSNYSLLRDEENESDEDTLWSFRITIAISFFDIMVRRAIVKGCQDHMWMFYYKIFIELLLDNMSEYDALNPDKNKDSRNYDLVETIVSNMLDWKEVSIKSKKYQLVQSIYDCIGGCIFKISSSNKLRREDKLNLFDTVWSDLVETTTIHNEEREIIEDEVVSIGISMFLRPSLLFDNVNRDARSLSYIDIVNYMWNERDTVIEEGVAEERAAIFLRDVITPFNA